MNDLDYFMRGYKYSALVHDNKCACTKHVKFCETAGSKVWLINPNESPIEINKLERLDNKEHFAHEIDGTWACIIQDKNTNMFRAISSINNELPWYYSLTSPFIISNNIYPIIVLNGSKEPDEVSIATFVTFDHAFAGATFIKGVKKTYGGDIIYLNKNSVKVVKDNLEKWLGFDDSVKDPRILVQHFIDEVDKCLRDPDPEITLTSGADSRIVLAAGLLTKRKFNLMTGVLPTVDKLDVKIATRIGEILKIDHIRIDASKREINNIEDVIERMTIETNAEFIPRNWIMFYKEYVLEKNLIQKSRLLGYGGEIYKGFYNDLNRTFSKKTAILNTELRNKVIDNAFNTYNIYRDINERNSLNLFYQRERSHFWVPMNIRTNLSYCKCYSPLMSPVLLGLAYRVTGGIENSKIHDMMLETLPENIKNLPSHYGRIEFIWNYIRRNYIKKSINYDLFLKPDFLRNKINYKLFENIISPVNIKKMLNQYETRGLNDSVLHKIFAVSNFFRIINN